MRSSASSTYLFDRTSTLVAEEHEKGHEDLTDVGSLRALLRCSSATARGDEFQRRDGGWITLEHYWRFFSEPINLGVLLDTIALGFKVIVFTTIVGYPVALLFLILGPTGRRVLLFLTILPMLTSNVVRTLAWIAILGREGVVNNALLGLGLTSTPIQFMYNEIGLIIALSQIELPLLVLPLVSVLAKVDRSLWEASTSLGMNAWQSFARIILPLSIPGLMAGWILVFASACMNFVTQAVIGGARLIYLPQFIYQEVNTLYDWPFAAAIAIVMLTTTGIVMAALTAVSRNRRINVYA